MTLSSRQRPNGLRLPLEPEWKSEDEYVDSVLTFATTSDLFRNLCGGVHVLDFLTREPDLYTTVLPKAWRDWFDSVDIESVLGLLLRDDLEKWSATPTQSTESRLGPPRSLLEYVRSVRRHSLSRDFSPVYENISDLPRHVSMGMKTKKIHEVKNFAAYVNSLCGELSTSLNNPNDSQKLELTVVDFGSGQNYLGRTLASDPYNKHVIAIEKRHHNITGAKNMDVHAKLATKEKIMRNKKEWIRQLAQKSIPTPPSEADGQSEEVPQTPATPASSTAEANIVAIGKEEGKGSMTYLEHDIKDGYLEDILTMTRPPVKHRAEEKPSQTHHTTSLLREALIPPAKHIIVSLHSCGNLTHHDLRSLAQNPSIEAVAAIGCCYNLLSERLGPATYKLPNLRPNHPRLTATGEAYDPHGFPMSKRLEDFTADGKSRGVRLNITARMMAVQAPHNWGPTDSEAFFRRHFYRTLLQKMLLDVGVVKQCPDPGMPSQVSGGSITGRDELGTPLIVGSLPKRCFENFGAYVKGALAKLKLDPVDGERITELTKHIDQEVVDEYERRFGYAKKHLSVVWSLMAFSAGVVESIIVTDRWLFLREQDCVADAWVDIAFDYKLSPRNFVVVGLKKQEHAE